jgi:hypothetical protein
MIPVRTILSLDSSTTIVDGVGGPKNPTNKGSTPVKHRVALGGHHVSIHCSAPGPAAGDRGMTSIARSVGMQGDDPRVLICTTHLRMLIEAHGKRTQR